MAAPLPQNQLLDWHCGLMGTAMRSTAAVAQTAGAFRVIAAQPFVAGLPAHVKIRAQLGQRKPSGHREADETMLLFHGRYLVPGHSPESVTHVLGISVTYVPGSYHCA